MTKKKTKILTIDEVKHVAKLADLVLSQHELTKFQIQLDQILELVSKLQEIPTGKVSPTNQVTGLENVLREDGIDSSRMLSQDEALKNANRSHKGFFVVPKILET